MYKQNKNIKKMTEKHKKSHRNPRVEKYNSLTEEFSRNFQKLAQPFKRKNKNLEDGTLEITQEVEQKEKE